MRQASVLAVLVALLAVAQTATAASQQQVDHSRHVVAFFQNHHWLRAPEQPNCRTVPWTRSCKIARRVYAKHKARIAAFEQQFTIGNTGNWTRAMRLAQRPFPGTYDWLSFISNRECRACFTVPGGFVCNREGSGACGPVQFMSGTFWSYAFGIGYGAGPGAKAWLAARGYHVDPSVWSWRNALAQALTAAYMRYTDRDGCHWC